MLNQALCSKCRKEGWNIKIDYSSREVEFTCMGCGNQERLSDLFGGRKKVVKRKPNISLVEETSVVEGL